jgi:hypothetical protein
LQVIALGNNILGLCKKAFAAAGGRILFWQAHHFRNFASRNFENDVPAKR